MICCSFSFFLWQLANVMGHSQWLTCPRKVTEIFFWVWLLYGQVATVLLIFHANNFRICQLGGFIVILVQCLSRSITRWENGYHTGWGKSLLLYLIILIFSLYSKMVSSCSQPWRLSQNYCDDLLNPRALIAVKLLPWILIVIPNQQIVPKGTKFCIQVKRWLP